MKKFNIDVELDGIITFVVEAKNIYQARKKVDEVFETSTLKDVILQNKNLKVNQKIREEKGYERWHAI